MSQGPPPNPFAPPVADVDGAVAEGVDAGAGQFTADRGSRLGAAILDSLLYAACAIPGLALAYLHFGLQSFLGARQVQQTSLIVYGCMLPLAIYQWYRVSTTGQSLGKKWLGIRIVKLDGGPVDLFSGVFLRAWVPAAIAFGLTYLGARAGSKNVGTLFNFVDALAIFGPTSRCLHDYLAGTKVVRAS